MMLIGLVEVTLGVKSIRCRGSLLPKSHREKAISRKADYNTILWCIVNAAVLLSLDETHLNHLNDAERRCMVNLIIFTVMIMSSFLTVSWDSCYSENHVFFQSLLLDCRSCFQTWWPLSTVGHLILQVVHALAFHRNLAQTARFGATR